MAFSALKTYTQLQTLTEADLHRIKSGLEANLHSLKECLSPERALPKGTREFIRNQARNYRNRINLIDTRIEDLQGAPNQHVQKVYRKSDFAK